MNRIHRCDAYDCDAIADPTSYEMTLVESQDIGPEEESDEDETKNDYDYFEIDKQLNRISEANEGRSRKNSLEFSGFVGEKIPKETSAKGQGVFVDMAENSSSLRMSDTYRGIKENNVARKKNLLFGNGANRASGELPAHDPVISNLYQQKELLVYGDNVLGRPTKNTLPPVRHAKRMAYQGRQQNKIINSPPPQKAVVSNSIRNIPSLKYNERSMEYNFQHLKKFPPGHNQRSRSLTLLEAAQVKKINSKWHGTDPKRGPRKSLDPHLRLAPLGRRQASLDNLPDNNDSHPDSTWVPEKQNVGFTTDRSHVHTKYQPERSSEIFSPALQPKMQRPRSRRNSLNKVEDQSQNVEWVASRANVKELESLPSETKYKFGMTGSAKRNSEKSGPVAHPSIFVVQRPQDSFWQPTLGHSYSPNKTRTNSMMGNASKTHSSARTTQIEKEKDKTSDNDEVELLKQQVAAQKYELAQIKQLMGMYKGNRVPTPSGFGIEIYPRDRELGPVQHKKRRISIDTYGLLKLNCFYDYISTSSHIKRRLRKYLWAIAYPTLLDIYAETEVMQRVEEIRTSLAEIKERTEDVIF